ncbi:helix-turn-helix domain-containing protein [Niallia oryzisoli]|uniref:Helix-turn-helix domain-containing protein n=1 Tax=Niallia oryzisoli TaxID=1737571 RepID=A0ABZ2CK77_9BACI
MLTFQELICASPFYHVEIIGGWKGKENSFSIVEDDTACLDKPVLFIIPSNAEKISMLDEYVTIQSVKGILIYGKTEPYIPRKTLEFIETLNKPVLFLKDDINPFSLKKTAADLAQLKTMGLYHYVYEHSTNYWLSLLQEQGLEGFLQRISLFIGQEIFLLNEHFYLHPIYEESGIRGQFKHLASLFYQQSAGNSKNEIFTMIKDGQHHYFLIPVISGNHHFGFILFQEQPSMMIDVYIEQVIHTIPALLSYYKNEESVLKAHQSYKENFLYNLLYNNLESEQQLIKQGKQWGWDFTMPTELMVLRINQKNKMAKTSIDTASVMRKIRSLISSQFLQVITFLLQGDIIIIVFDSENLLPKHRKELSLSLAQQLFNKLEQGLSDLECQIGIGRHYASNLELFRSFYEAKLALELGKYEIRHKAVRHFEDIGIARLLSNIHQHKLHEYYTEVLKDILVDKENSTIYLDTLHAFFQNNADINQTAEQLYIHPNTLRKRIKKIESILNIDFNQLDDLLEIYVTLKIMKMIK